MSAAPYRTAGQRRNCWRPSSARSPARPRTAGADASDDARARFDRLTPGEREVLAHVLRGRLNKQIAADLGITERSVKRHRTSLMAKHEAGSVADLTRLAVEAGIS